MGKGEEIFREAMDISLREGYPVLTEDHPFFNIQNCLNSLN